MRSCLRSWKWVGLGICLWCLCVCKNLCFVNVNAHVYFYVCMCVFVCVNHLKRCKTSIFDFRIYLLVCLHYSSPSRGTIHVLWAMVQRSGHSTCGYHGWSPWRTCFIFSMSMFRNGDRPSQEPACRPIGLPIPFLHGFRNLNFHCHLRMIVLHQNEQVCVSASV
jgi:hypothetical protein